MSDAPALATTESIDPRTRGLDTLATEDLVALFARDGAVAAEAVVRAAPAIARAVDAIAARLRAGGTLHYVGAGTSGRLAMLDAAECPPTFGTQPELVVAHVAGGRDALVRAIEGAEDDATAGEFELREAASGRDAVVGISASGGAPYVLGALAAARALGALTIGITSVAGSRVARDAEIAIVTETGPEALAGSTRLKAGTAQKLVLNAISTGVMIRLGRVYENVMVDVVSTNAKLRSRALRLVREIARVDDARAAALLADSGGSVKIAIAMNACGIDAATARERLDAAGGFLRAIL